jgi:LemA protein
VEAVRQFNTAVRTFPANLLAGMFNFEVLPQFKAEEKDTQVPVVDFSDGK